jgi:hypothetical protein
VTKKKESDQAYIDIGKDEEGNVILDFGEEVSRITLSKEVAEHMAQTILKIVREEIQ